MFVMSIPEFDISVLSEISSDALGRSMTDLEHEFGKEVRSSIKFLIENDLAKIHERDIRPFMPPTTDYRDPPKGNIVATDLGRLEVKRWNTKKLLSKKERWKERFIGALVTLAIWALQEVTKYLL